MLTVEVRALSAFLGWWCLDDSDCGVLAGLCPQRHIEIPWSSPPPAPGTPDTCFEFSPNRASAPLFRSCDTLAKLGPNSRDFGPSSVNIDQPRSKPARFWSTPGQAMRQSRPNSHQCWHRSESGKNRAKLGQLILGHILWAKFGPTWTKVRHSSAECGPWIRPCAPGVPRVRARLAQFVKARRFSGASMRVPGDLSMSGLKSDEPDARPKTASGSGGARRLFVVLAPMWAAMLTLDPARRSGPGSPPSAPLPKIGAERAGRGVPHPSLERPESGERTRLIKGWADHGPRDRHPTLPQHIASEGDDARSRRRQRRANRLGRELLHALAQRSADHPVRPPRRPRPRADPPRAALGAGPRHLPRGKGPLAALLLDLAGDPGEAPGGRLRRTPICGGVARGGGGGAQGGGPESGARGPRPSALQARVTNSGADFEAPEPVRRTRSGVLKLRTRSETAGADSSSKPPQALGARSSDEERFRRALAPDVGPLPPADRPPSARCCRPPHRRQGGLLPSGRHGGGRRRAPPAPRLGGHLGCVSGGIGGQLILSGGRPGGRPKF